MRDRKRHERKDEKKYMSERGIGRRSTVERRKEQ